MFRWTTPENPSRTGTTIWNTFKEDTSYFSPSSASFMINFRVDDLHALLAALRAEGCDVDTKVNESEYGKFGWVMDPEGNRIELWQPPDGQCPGGWREPLRQERLEPGMLDARFNMPRGMLLDVF